MFFLERLLGRRAQPREEIRIPPHKDYLGYDEEGKLRIHAAFRHDTTPEEASQAFSKIAINLIENTPEGIKPEAAEEMARILREEAQNVLGVGKIG